MGFDNTRFPLDISFGSRAGPGFKTEIIELKSGSEERLSRWQSPRHRYDVGYGVRTYNALIVVKKFFMARRGAAQGFRLRDWQDYATSSSGTLYQEDDVATSGTDQNLTNTVTLVLGKGDGTTKLFQMVKEYVDPIQNFIRTIAKPVLGTVKVTVAAVLQTESTHYSVDYQAGTVLFVTAPGLNVDVKWGGEFDVPVRFDLSVDEWLSMSFDDFSDGSYPSIPMMELVDDVLVPDRFWPGGTKDHGNVSVDVTANLVDGRVHRVNPQNAGRAIILQRADDIPSGAQIFYVQNASGTQTLAIKLTDGSTLVTLAVNGIGDVAISDNGSGVKTFIAAT
jgi:uncharacterized protein (TIGR02217 family)